MVPFDLPLVVATAAVDVARGTTIAIVALLVLVLVLGVAAFVVLFRRGGDRASRGTPSQATLESTAAALLVKLDDRLREAEHEVGFAVAQFGVASARDFGDALTTARLKLTEAFRLGQQRDTAASDAEQLRRRNTLQMVALCNQALASLDRFDSEFAERRRTEVDAGHTASALHTRLGVLRDQLSAVLLQREEATKRYGEAVLTVVTKQLTQAETFLASAEHGVNDASPEISPTGVNAVAERLQAAASQLHRADQLLATSAIALTELGDAEVAVRRLRATSESDLREARIAVDRAPDPTTGAQILAAIAAGETALAATAVDPNSQRDPFRQLTQLADAGAELDSALATARNQQQRFDHARAAYRGTLIAARSQIGVVRELVGRGGVSANARTRLAEAERQLMIAEAETDPVEALDAIRRSVTHARDADALARY
ncbi:hypothetical protein [Salinibacterium sp. PAMC 21357]|uniref:hypothetical protein n=1 Tax=Salinibacterium sp. PAMC 21357 TaxID=1112215 RepID=UPI0002886CA5|nr:hypothetical protein [Salinibacterium sp. PAMC 21357]